MLVVGFSRLSHGVMYDNTSEQPIPYSYSGGQAVAQSGYVFLSRKGYYYLKVTNPDKYKYVTQEEADKSGYRLKENG